VTGALDEDLARAAHRALALDPEACRRHALQFGWDVITRQFEANLVPCRSGEFPPVASGCSAGSPPPAAASAGI
jgi:hypothetical protein